MFDITIKGRVARKKDLKEYVQRVMHHYFGNRLRRVIDLDIQMYTEIDEGSIAGYCYGDKDAVQIELARNWSKSQRKNRVKRPFTYDELVLNKFASVELKNIADVWYILSSDGMKNS